MSACAERISIVRGRLLERSPFFGELALRLRITESREVQTAAVSKTGRMFINPDFFMGLSPAEQAGTLAHEVLHPALRFWARRKGRDPMIANIAHDLAFNPWIEEAPSATLALPTGALLDPRFKGKSFEEIYDEIVAELKRSGEMQIRTKGGGSITVAARSPNGDGQGDGQSGDQGDGQGSDDGQAGAGSSAQGASAEQNKGGAGASGGAQPPQGAGDDKGGANGAGAQDGDQGDDQSPGKGSFRIKDQDGNDVTDDYMDCERSDDDEDDPDAVSEKEWDLAVVEAVKRAKSKGCVPGGAMRYADELLDSQVDWVGRLRRYVGERICPDERSWRRFHRRSHAAGLALPGAGDSLPDVVVLLDTSGSMGRSELRIALSEIQGILADTGAEARVLVVDAKIHRDVTIEEASEIEMVGGGGSDFRPAFARLHQECYTGVVVAITDGYIDVPGEQPPSLQGCVWLTFDDQAPPTADWGEHIQVQLETAR